MNDLDAKLKHLEMIEAVINRMASNSFLFKGWSITIIVGISAFAAKDSNSSLFVISIVATLLFWFVDAYYLMLERSFRDLYSDVAKKDPKEINFSMKTKDKKIGDWLLALRRPSLLLFYSLVLLLLFLALLIIIYG